MFRHIAFITAAFLLTSTVEAKIVIEPVNYKQGDTTLKGWVSYDDTLAKPAPGILIFPEWWGLTDYPKQRAQQLAKLGYVAFAADMYGDGKTTDDPAEAGKLSGALGKNPDELRVRAKAALETLKKNPRVDPSKIAAIGYCFGGGVALELARSGADIKATVTFHGSLTPLRPGSKDAEQIKGDVLVCTGAEDQFIPPKQVQALEEELKAAKVNFEILILSGAHHAFTNPDADRHNIPNIKYNKTADERSWSAMKELFNEVFNGGPKA